jgi:hypothetical protein
MKSDEILIKTFDQVKNDNFDQVKFDQVIVCRNIPTQSRKGKTIQSFTFFSPKVASVKVQLI